MKRPLRMSLYSLALLLIIAAGVGFVFRKQIHEYYAVYQYANTFKPDVIDENFRSLYKIYPSIRVEHSGEVSPLPQNENLCLKPIFIRERQNGSRTGWSARRQPVSSC